MSASPARETVDWREAASRDLAYLQWVASHAFVTGRWHVDWRIGPVASGGRYADWVRRSLENPQHEVLVALHEHRPAGFFILERQLDGTVYWHLTAVDPDRQGMGLGRAMWSDRARRDLDKGAHVVRTTITARNLPVVNLYARLGWRFEACDATFQWVPEECADA